MHTVLQKGVEEKKGMNHPPFIYYVSFDVIGNSKVEKMGMNHPPLFMKYLLTMIIWSNQ